MKQIKDKFHAMEDACPACGESLKRECPACGKRVLVVQGRLKAHDAGVVHGSHMTWGACKGSGQ